MKENNFVFVAVTVGDKPWVVASGFDRETVERTVKLLEDFDKEAGLDYSYKIYPLRIDLCP